jgi:hypothetical protein
MLGWGCGPILEALPMPLGSTVALFNPPAFAGPRGIPLIGTFPVPAEPAARANPPCPPCPPRANEAAGGVRTMDTAIAIFSALLDIRKLPYDSLEQRSREADVGSQSIDTTKLNFKQSETQQALVHSR